MSKFKIFVIVILVLIVAGGVVAYRMFNRPNRTVENETGISITAAQLVKAFQKNETEANKKYLNKTLEVSGTVAEVGSNQDRKATVMLSAEDAFTGVFCTLKVSEPGVASGTSIVIKGICSGMLTDVRLSEAVILNP